MAKYIGKKYIIQSLFCFVFLLILCTCNDPVFYAISQEVKPIKPRIKGTPTNIVEYKSYMYVASGYTLYKYNSNTQPYWSNMGSPSGRRILRLASANNNLYALCATDENITGQTVIYHYNDSEPANPKWVILSDSYKYTQIQSIYTAGTGTGSRLFLYTKLDKTTNNYKILYIDAGTPSIINELATPQTGDAELCGAASIGSTYYLATKNKGVYKVTGNTGTPIADTPVDITGIINLSANTILLITRESGRVYTFDTTENIQYTNIQMGRYSNGTLAIWEKSSSERLLLAGRQEIRYSTSSGHTYGYMELELDANGIKTGANFIEPGIGPVSTIYPGGNERFLSTIGKQPVNFIFQTTTSDSNRIIFASTQKNGVWSYRERGSLPQWNAEGEDEPKY